MDKKEYIVNQLRRTFNKKYENYCITRIYHLLNRLDVKIVTQQLFKRDNSKIALADLYFPQINLIVEIDEGHHLTNKEEDKKRTEEIIKNKIQAFEEVIYYNLEIERIDVTKDIDCINNRVEEVIELVKERINKLGSKFESWNENYRLPQYYIDIGYIDSEDDVKFRTIQEVSELFNKGYKGTQKAWFSDKKDSNIRIWCPKVKVNGVDYKVPYSNEFNEDGTVIYENSLENNEEFIYDMLEGKEKDLTIRYVFTYYKDSSGMNMYRFKGIYEVDKEATVKEQKRVWRKVGNKVELKEYFVK